MTDTAAMSAQTLLQYYPSAAEVDNWCETVRKRAAGISGTGRKLEEPLYQYQLGVRHGLEANAYIAFEFAGRDPFYGYWQPVPGGGPAPLLIHLPGYGAEMSAHPELVTRDTTCCMSIRLATAPRAAAMAASSGMATGRCCRIACSAAARPVISNGSPMCCWPCVGHRHNRKCCPTASVSSAPARGRYDVAHRQHPARQRGGGGGGPTALPHQFPAQPRGGAGQRVSMGNIPPGESSAHTIPRNSPLPAAPWDLSIR